MMLEYRQRCQRAWEKLFAGFGADAGQAEAMPGLRNQSAEEASLRGSFAVVVPSCHYQSMPGQTHARIPML